MLLKAVAIAAGIFALCLAIDLCRILLFRLFRVEHLCKSIVRRLEKSEN